MVNIFLTMKKLLRHGQIRWYIWTTQHWICILFISYYW